MMSKLVKLFFLADAVISCGYQVQNYGDIKNPVGIQRESDTCYFYQDYRFNIDSQKFGNSDVPKLKREGVQEYREIITKSVKIDGCAEVTIYSGYNFTGQERCLVHGDVNMKTLNCRPGWYKNLAGIMPDGIARSAKFGCYSVYYIPPMWHS